MTPQNEKPRRDSGAFPNSHGASIPTRQAIVELMRTFLTDDWLDFARKTHGANPAQSTEAIFEFLADAWNYKIAEWLAAAELLYIAELEATDDAA